MSEKCKICKNDCQSIKGNVKTCIRCNDFYENETEFESLYEKDNDKIVIETLNSALPHSQNYLFKNYDSENISKPRNRKERRHGREFY